MTAARINTTTTKKVHFSVESASHIKNGKGENRECIEITQKIEEMERLILIDSY